jgi:hypothetical protein
LLKGIYLCVLSLRLIIIVKVGLKNKAKDILTFLVKLLILKIFYIANNILTFLVKLLILKIFYIINNVLTFLIKLLILKKYFGLRLGIYFVSAS